ncbi:MAG: Serine/threonine protein phosphatase [Rhizobium sp.]|nr:Serine/threonine protein phosphatase [Rhizobium sp.]
MGFTLAIGDIHGCSEQLGQLLDSIEMWWPGGTIVFLGDYVDRGPDSRGVLLRLMAGPTKPGWKWIALKGNHEEMMVSALKIGEHVSRWLENGGEETSQSYGGHVPDVVLDWADNLPTIHVDEHRIFVHAGVDDAIPLDAQSERTLLWSRPPVGSDNDYWGKHLCHGHTPRSGNPTTTGNRTNVDSGCVFGGSLTAAVFDDDLAGPPIRFINIANRSVL